MSKPEKLYRCAIYTRVSTDAGLDQEFNSLNAQREAAEAYVKSQAHEGWRPLPTPYDDGGFSGGSLDRPALQQLLTDIKAGSIDIVLVYKVDRLTRCLADFAKLVELFDANGVSFVSVTQAFNTTTSMGRLTLNVLLSFAQFEREVTAERIRDKVAASKKNGMWMGGNVPLGYRAVDRKLVIAEDEAPTVKMIFRRYLELGSAIRVIEELRQAGVRTRLRQRGGKTVGGVFFRVPPLLYLLKNPIYVGEIHFRGKVYAGEHPALIEKELFDAVQAQIAAATISRREASSPNHLLTGRIIDDRGNVMTPTHSRKGPRRWYYYISRAFIEGRKGEVGTVPRVAGHDIEPKIVAALRDLAQPRADVSEACSNDRSLVEKLLSRVVVSKDQLILELKEDIGISAHSPLQIQWNRKPGRPKRKLVFAAPRVSDQRPIKPEWRQSLLRAIVQGRIWLHELTTDKVSSAAEIAKREGRTERSVHMILSLAFLAPDIVAATVAGTLPRGIGVTKLMELPPLWTDQRDAIARLWTARPASNRSLATS